MNEIYILVIIDIKANNDPDKCGANVWWAVSAAMDNCSGLTVSQIASPAPVSFIAVGNTQTITYEATGDDGNTAKCSFDVTIEETEIPKITCPDNIVVAAAGSLLSGAATIASFAPCGVTLSYIAPVGTDNCPGAVTTLSGGLGAGPNYYQYGGFYTETYTVTDAAGQVAICSFTITVEDPVPPQITCPQDITVATMPVHVMR